MKMTIGRIIIIVIIAYLISFAYKIIMSTDWKKPLTLLEASQIIHHSRIEGILFDVPLLYKYHLYEKNFKHWPRFKDYKRYDLDGIKITAILPDMKRYSEENATEFNVSGFGNKVQVLLTPYHINWPYYFDNAFKRLIVLPESSVVPNMFHYRDPMSDNQDIYMSNEQPVRELTEIRCTNPELDPYPPVYPDCKVVTLYRNQFRLDYYFSLKHLKQWHEMDKKIRSLLDSFIMAAMKTP